MIKKETIQAGLSMNERLKLNIQQIRFLSNTINKLYFESMLKKLNHIYKK
jgi:hypothetical protein